MARPRHEHPTPNELEQTRPTGDELAEIHKTIAVYKRKRGGK